MPYFLSVFLLCTLISYFLYSDDVGAKALNYDTYGLFRAMSSHNPGIIIFYIEKRTFHTSRKYP